MKNKLRQFLFGTSLNNDKVLNIVWLVFRLHIGLSIAIHAGWPKMYTLAAPGWFNNQVAGLGFTFPSPAFWATLASWGEFAGGICIALGLLTRLSAIQLAFQFFVISFLWYDNPEPLSGMYFQQTLFFCYLLTAFAGGGRYALDKVLINRRTVKNTGSAKTIIAIIAILFYSNSFAQPAITGNDFKPLAGSWKGTLTYMDYTSNKLVTIKASAMIKNITDTSFDQYTYYTDEPDMNTKDDYQITNKGTLLNKMKVVENNNQSNGVTKIVLEYTGIDGNDNKAATIQEVLLFSASSFTRTKIVRFEGEKAFFQRHQYSFTR